MIATDIDPIAIKTTQTNAKINQVTPYLRTGIADGMEHSLIRDAAPFDLILANMNRNVIEVLIPKFQSSKSTILLSGLLETDYGAIEKLCHNNHLQVKEKIIKGEWICIVI